MVQTVPADQEEGLALLVAEATQSIEEDLPVHHQAGHRLLTPATRTSKQLVGEPVTALLSAMMVDQHPLGRDNQPPHRVGVKRGQVTPRLDVDLSQHRLGHIRIGMPPQIRVDTTRGAVIQPPENLVPWSIHIPYTFLTHPI